MENLNDLKNIPIKVQYIVFGYVNNDSIFNIPIDIINIIVLYYYIFFEFYTEKCGDGLQFIDKTVTLIDYNSTFSTCLFGELITEKICNKYEIHFQYTTQSTYFSFFFGYAKSKNSIKDWNDHIGDNENKKESVGIFVGSYFDFTLYDENNYDKVLQYKSAVKFKNKDIFGLLFDFENDALQIYHNYNKADKLSLNKNKSVVIAISLVCKNDSVQILKHKFHS